jgi:pilus assembly protein Flp/PilA
VKLGVGNLQRRAQAQDGLGHLIVTMEGRPVQRRALVLPPGVHGPATREHEPNDGGLIVAGGPTAVECAVVLALIIIACVTIIQSLGGSVSGTFSTVNGATSS